jgi:hypothetical protein
VARRPDALMKACPIKSVLLTAPQRKMSSPV